MNQHQLCLSAATENQIETRSCVCQQRSHEEGRPSEWREGWERRMAHTHTPHRGTTRCSLDEMIMDSTQMMQLCSHPHSAHNTLIHNGHMAIQYHLLPSLSSSPSSSPTHWITPIHTRTSSPLSHPQRHSSRLSFQGWPSHIWAATLLPGASHGYQILYHWNHKSSQ